MPPPGRFVAVSQSALTRILGDSTVAGARHLGNRIRVRAQEMCPKSVREGDESGGSAGRMGPPLWTTIQARVFADPSAGWRVLVGSPSPVAAYVHEGTPPHLIQPAKAQVLRFRSRSTGQVVFAAQVNHPGTRPNPFIRIAMEEVVRSI